MQAVSQALTFNFAPFPELETARLRLRRISLADTKAIFIMRSNPSLMQYIARPVAVSEEDVVELIGRMESGLTSNQTINWGITLKPDDQVIGVAGYVRSTPEHHRAEIGYMLSDDLHGQGIMSEAVEAILDYGFRQMHLHLVEAVTDPRNVASARVLEKMGFVKEAYFRENCLFQGEFLDSVHFSLLARDFNR